MISPTLFYWQFLLLLPTASAFPVNQRLINEAKEETQTQLLSIPVLGRHPQEPQAHSHQPPHFAHFAQHKVRKHWHRHHRKRISWMEEALVYLKKFGYLDLESMTKENVELGLKAFQQTVNIADTGKLDKNTINGMRLPRCGNADVTPEEGERRVKRFAQVSKWLNKLDQNDVLRLKWHIQKYTKDIDRSEIRRIVKKAFQLWSDQIGIPSMRPIRLHFQEADNAQDADINIMWATGNHGDAYPFDGPGEKTNILAHTFYPNYQETGSLNGDIHFDDHERWVLNNTLPGGVHFPYVLVHEIGHALGLGHSKRQEAVMNPIYKKYDLDSIVLDLDDKCAINWNYVGPTQTCLFVWLMVELLPIAKESNVTTHGIASVINITNLGPNQHQWNDQSLEERLNYTLETLQGLSLYSVPNNSLSLEGGGNVCSLNVLPKEAEIPQCTDENNVQSEYEQLLQQKLSFDQTTAVRYGPVVCNFLDGLSRVVRRSNGQGPQRSNSVQRLTVHQYTRNRDVEFMNGPSFDDALESETGLEQRSRSRRSPTARKRKQKLIREGSEEQNHILFFQRDWHPETKNQLSVFDREFFDDGFYQNLLTLFVKQKR